MNNVYNLKDKLVLFLLTAGMICFGVVLPDSLSDHNKLVHFAAHFGMSFLLALSFFMICTIRMRISKKISYTVLITATLFIGVLYKFWEIATQGMIGSYSFHTIMDHTGVMTSMSQNISGLMGAVLLIEGLVDRNLAYSSVRVPNTHLNRNDEPGIPFINTNRTLVHGSGLPAGSQFSPEPSEK
jgi:hypothetical protein